MIYNFRFYIANFFLVMMIGTTGMSAQINIVELPTPAKDGAHTVPWISDGDKWWQGDAPLFVLEKTEDLSARGWAAVSSEGICLRVIVKDKIHFNPHDGRDIWRGDAIQIGIDGKGDRSGEASANTYATFGPDDMALTIALTDSGPEGIIHISEMPGLRRSPIPSKYIAITRDEKTRLTTYNLTVPWTMLDTVPGIFPTIGLAVQINNVDAQDNEQTRLYFGRGADGIPRPGLFEVIVPEAPPRGLVGLVPVNAVLWNENDSAQIATTIASKRPLVIKAKLGGTEVSKAVPGDGKIHRYLIHGRPQALDQAHGVSLAASVYPDGTDAVAHESIDLIVPVAVYHALIKELAQAAATTKHPLMKRHFRSVDALVRMEWARMMVYGPNDPVSAQDTLERLIKIREGFRNDASDWDSYLQGRRQLVFTFLSKRDGTLQYYTLGLPKNWDPEKAYPLFLELHGAGNPNPLNGVAGQVGGEAGAAPELHGYTAPISYAGLQGNGYHLNPFGRGNSGYIDIGEIDVWEAMADFHKTFTTDPDRRYLFGFSMGGAGTWRLATRTPDLWAAVAIFSAGGRRGFASSALGRNVTELPIWMWCGEDDRLLGGMRQIKAQIERYGPAPVYSTSPGVGHAYIGEKQVEAINWLQRHTRKRPDSFQYVADTPKHLGVWGITIVRDQAKTGEPSFTCRIEGNHVMLETRGTPSVKINLGRGGLGLDGEVKVTVNGKMVYEGPTDTITIPTVLFASK